MQPLTHTNDVELISTQQDEVLTGDDMPKPEAKMRLSKDDIGVGIV